MNLLDPHRFDQLPEPEALHRIGELVALMLERERVRGLTPPPEALPIPDAIELIADPMERHIMAYLTRYGATNIARLARALGEPVGVVKESLGKLRAKGLCEQIGRTSDARYQPRRNCHSN